MPTWGKILAEIQNELKNNYPAAFDTVRNKYLRKLSDKTKRNTIIYASRWFIIRKIEPRYRDVVYFEPRFVPIKIL